METLLGPGSLRTLCPLSPSAISAKDTGWCPFMSQVAWSLEKKQRIERKPCPFQKEDFSQL